MIATIFDEALLGKNYADFFPNMVGDFILPLSIDGITIQPNGLKLPPDDFYNELLKRPSFINFDLIFEIYFRELIYPQRVGRYYTGKMVHDYLMGVMSIPALNKSNDRKIREVLIKTSKIEAQRFIAIARQAMLNAHENHPNIERLPKIKLIQQK